MTLHPSFPHMFTGANAHIFIHGGGGMPFTKGLFFRIANNTRRYLRLKEPLSYLYQHSFIYRRTAPVTFGFCRPKGLYFRVAVTLGWLKNVCGIALPTSGERDEEIYPNGLENYTIGLHSSQIWFLDNNELRNN